ncbi:MAG: hypothetical protein CME64_00435 [Halobacteriovoraceae bacterium]|nr:hypothetical protein [Halobacteriovoraceae bacterium]|tara:strand:+ start:108030 stop:108923 length:894 start_codon:yes stop_codon:yes gene_type:complete
MNLEEKLLEIFKKHVRPDEFGDVLKYIMFPAGKLFRPKLSLAMAEDLGTLNDDHYLLALAIETHHAYSLVHDDLPCMDDDDVRRGRPAAHIKYGEWKALLAGDSLINLSYEFLASMESDKAKQLILDFSKMMGAQGLILGQVIDLSHQNKKFEDTLLMHELKTARLIQFSLLGSQTLATTASIGREETLLLGKYMGINFQLFDDLAELGDPTDEHEEQVNAFLNYDALATLEYIVEGNKVIKDTLERHSLTSVGEVYRAYLQKMSSKIESSIDTIAKAVENNSPSFRQKLEKALLTF